MSYCWAPSTSTVGGNLTYSATRAKRVDLVLFLNSLLLHRYFLHITSLSRFYDTHRQERERVVVNCILTLSLTENANNIFVSNNVH